MIISRQTGEEEEWKLDSMMKAIESEIRARERSSAKEIKKSHIPTKEQTTGSALLTGGSILPTCCFYKQELPSRDCTTVVDVESRRQSSKK